MKPGEFLLPVGLAVLEDQVFVLDGETATVSRLDLAGRYQGRFGGQGLGRGTFQDPKALVAAEGHLFVLDYGNRQVQRLTPEGGTSPATPSAAPARTGPLGSSGGWGWGRAGSTFTTWRRSRSGCWTSRGGFSPPTPCPFWRGRTG